jgi:hypothetical protein
MENECWLCECPLDEDEVQYGTHCELQLLSEILQEENSNA